MNDKCKEVNSLENNRFIYQEISKFRDEQQVAVEGVRKKVSGTFLSKKSNPSINSGQGIN